ncbi:MAG: 50S ribosomal protein L20, partial [Salinivirgaceae bacterium]|nr:50S ribosomal protein L20 [Salinivirgaceae bacterium]
ARQYGLSYSELIGKLAKANVEINRKVLADLAMNQPKAFEAVVKSVK